MSFKFIFGKNEIRIIEPSVGAGNFIPFLIKRYEDVGHVILDVVDIDRDSVETVRQILKKIHVPENFTINVFCNDFLTMEAQFTPATDIVCGYVEITINIQINGKLKLHKFNLMVVKWQTMLDKWRLIDLSENRLDKNFVLEYEWYNQVIDMLNSFGYNTEKNYSKIEDLINWPQEIEAISS